MLFGEDAKYTGGCVCGLYAKTMQYEEAEGLGVHGSSEKNP